MKPPCLPDRSSGPHPLLFLGGVYISCGKWLQGWYWPLHLNELKLYETKEKETQVMSLLRHCRWWSSPNTAASQVSEPFHAVLCTKSQCGRERRVERPSQRGTTASYSWRLKKSFQFSFPWGGQKAKPEFTPNGWGCQNLVVVTSSTQVSYESANSPWAGSLWGQELARFNQYCLDKLSTNFFPRLCPFFETSFWWFLLWINGKCRVILPSLLSSLEVRAPNGKAFRIRSQLCLSFKKWWEVGWPKSLPLCCKWNQFNWKWKCRFS